MSDRFEHLRRAAAVALVAAVAASGCKSNSPGNDNGVANITVVGIAAPLQVGATARATATATDASGQPVSATFVWSSDHPSIASVTSDGTVTGVSAGNAVVSAAAGGKTGTLAITVNNATPILATISPTGAAAGASALTLTATGSGFIAASTIDWNGAPLSTSFVSSTQITAQVPGSDLALAGTAQVTVATPAPGGGVSASQPFAISVANNPAPTLTAVSPDTVRAGAGAFAVAVTGTGFVPASAVDWNGSPRSTTYVSPTQLTAQIASADIASAGSASVTVLNPAPGGGTSLARQVVVTAVPSVIASIAVGVDFVCAVSATGNLYCWGGRSDLGVLSTPVLAPLSSPASAVSLSPSGTSGFVCGLDAASHAYCSPGHFSDSMPIGGEGMHFIAVTASNLNACGIATNQLAYCWGQEINGQLGDGNTGAFDAGRTPVAVSGGHHYSRIAGSKFFSCALTTSGVTECWGALPLGALDIANVPTAVAGAPAFTSIAVGGAQACGLTAGGAAYCWGTLPAGDGSAALVTMPTAVGGGVTFTSLAVGDTSMICGIATSQAAYCWGDGVVPLGDGGHGGSAVPVLVAGGHQFTEIAAGARSACGAGTDGTVYCWGLREYGNIGDGTVAYVTAPASVTAGPTYPSLVVGEHVACGLTSVHQAYCWGNNAAGAVGDGTLTDRDAPGVVSGGLSFVSLSDNAQDHVCALTSGEAAYCWGSDSTGELGNGTLTPHSNVPVPVSGGLVFKQISAGRGSCGVATDGTGYCWGNAVTLGTGSSTASAVPVVVAGAHTWSAISAGSDHACGITTAGAAYCWGNGTSLGDGDVLTQHLQPVAVAGSHTFASIASSGSSTCGVTTTGAGYCWGVSDQTGQFINSTPTLVPGGLTWTSLKPGTADCGTTATGLYCWGTNDMGQIGQSNISFEISTPALIPGGPYQAFSPGTGLDDGLCATPTSGATVCWGNNYRGVLGNGTFGEARTPEAISGAISLRAAVRRR